MKRIEGFVIMMTRLYPKKEVLWEAAECPTLEKAMTRIHCWWDDKWDLKDRHFLRFYILDLTTMKRTRFKHWKTPFNFERWKKTKDSGK